MSWLLLIGSGLLEAVWARAMDLSSGFRKPLPTVVFLIALVLSLWGLSVAMLEIPTGTAYAVWTGVGATLTVLWGIVRGQESASAPRLVLVALLIGAVVGLKVVS